MTPLVAEAEKFAVLAHAGQEYGDHPYIVHPAAVAGVLRRFGVVDENLLAAAYLHDTMEDTGTKYQDLLDIFGKDVAELVYAVTNELGRDRQEKAAKTLPKTAAAGPRAVMLKLADRIANVQACIEAKADPNIRRKLLTYIREHPGFQETLGAVEHRAPLKAMFEELNTLMAFWEGELLPPGQRSLL